MEFSFFIFKKLSVYYVNSMLYINLSVIFFYMFSFIIFSNFLYINLKSMDEKLITENCVVLLQVEKINNKRKIFIQYDRKKVKKLKLKE